jgi:hypothetical protein
LIYLIRAEKYSNTGTTITIGNEPAKSLRITKKAKENANKTDSNRTREKKGISKTDVNGNYIVTSMFNANSAICHFSSVNVFKRR